MTDSLPSLQFSEVFTRSALPHSRPGYYMQCRLLTVSPFWLKLSYREYALVKGSLKDKQVTKKRNLCKSRNCCVDKGLEGLCVGLRDEDQLSSTSLPLLMLVMDWRQVYSGMWLSLEKIFDFSHNVFNPSKIVLFLQSFLTGKNFCHSNSCCCVYSLLTVVVWPDRRYSNCEDGVWLV